MSALFAFVSASSLGFLWIVPTCLYRDATLALLPVFVEMQCAFLSSLQRRLNCLRAPTPVISIENSVFPSFMLTRRPCASHVSSTICNSMVAEFTRDTGLSASNEKHASSTNVTSASVVVIQFQVSCWVCSSIRAFASEDTFQGGCAGWYMISFQIPCFSPAVRILRNTCSYIRLKAIPPSGHPCRLPRFVRTTKSSLSGISFEHTIQVAVCMSPTRSPNCALAPVRLIKFLSVIAK